MTESEADYLYMLYEHISGNGSAKQKVGRKWAERTRGPNTGTIVTGLTAKGPGLAVVTGGVEAYMFARP